MAEVPKIVRERLGRASAGSHPDADTLTAFAERALPERERGTILEHLAGCRSCREIMAVAVPVSADAQAAVRYWRRPWLTWPALRWGFAAAGIALVASLGVVNYQRHRGESMALYKAPVASAVKSASASLAAPAPALQDSHKELDKTQPRALLMAAGANANKSRQREEVARTAISAPVPQALSSATPALNLRDDIGGPLSHGPRANIQTNQANQWQQNAKAFNAQAATEKAATAPVNLPSNGRSLFETQTEPVQSADLTLQSQSLSQQSPQGGTDESKVDRAKPLETVNAGSPKAYVGTPASAKLERPTAFAGARWAINSSGGLQRSLDQGATWQDVNVNTSPAAASGMSLVANEQNEQKDQLESYAKKQKQSSPIVFRAIAANGADVWAGGVNGALYHSTDGGTGWTRVVPSSNDVILTGDVVSVNFPDALHGRIRTSTSEAWVTGDGGQSWDKK